MLADGSLMKCYLFDRELEIRLLLLTPINLEILELVSFGCIVVEGGSTSLENNW